MCVFATGSEDIIFMKFSHKTTGKGAILRGNMYVCILMIICVKIKIDNLDIYYFQNNHQKGSIKLLRLAHLRRLYISLGCSTTRLTFEQNVSMP